MKKEKERKFAHITAKHWGKMQPDAKLHLKVLSGPSFFLSSQGGKILAPAPDFTFSSSNPINSVEREEVSSQSNFRIL